MRWRTGAAPAGPGLAQPHHTIAFGASIDTLWRGRGFDTKGDGGEAAMRRRGCGRAAEWLLAAAVLTGCAPADPLDAPARTPMLRAATPTAPVEPDELRIDIRPGEKVGDFRSTFLRCSGLRDHLYWGQSIFRGVEADWIDIARSELHRAGYRLSSDPDNLFAGDSQYTQDPAYLLGARVLDLRLDVCDHVHWFSSQPLNLQSGQGWMRVQWSLFSVRQKRVIFQTEVTGKSIVGEATPLGAHRLSDRAFADAARRLAADAAFREHISRPLPHPDEARTSWIDLHIRKRPLFTRSLKRHSEDIRQSVVFVGSTAAGHGSGFFIAPSLILTNAHVVRGNRRVTITLPAGRRITGEVLRVRPRRDVALIRVEAAGYRPLPVREAPVSPGDTVYAVGAPYLEKLEGTISRGTVSAFRQNSDGLRDIQADVDTHPGNSGGPLLDARGNVVGLTYAGYRETPAGASIGLNLFIPIADALRNLNVRLGLPDSDMSRRRGIVMP